MPSMNKLGCVATVGTSGIPGVLQCKAHIPQYILKLLSHEEKDIIVMHYLGGGKDESCGHFPQGSARTHEMSGIYKLSGSYAWTLTVWI